MPDHARFNIFTNYFILGLLKKNGNHNSINMRLSHENILELLGIPCKSFVEMYNNKISDIQRSLHDYIKTVKAGA